MTTYASYKLRGAARPIDSAEFNAVPSRWTVAAQWLLLVALLAAPLAFGAVQPWGWGSLICLVAAALAMWGIGAVPSGNAQVVWTPLYFGWAATLLLGSLQWMTGASVNPIATREAILKCCAYAAIFFLAGTLLAGISDARLHRAGVTVTLYTLALSLFALVQFFAAPGKLYGVIEPRFGGWVFGPYVNHNHYAGLMELLVPVTFAFGFSSSRHVRFLAWFSAGVAFTSVLVSGSRGGAVCLVLAIVGLALVGMLGSGGTAPRRTIAGLMVLLTAILAFAAWMIPPQVSNRYQQTFKNADLAVADRVSINRDSWNVFRAHWLAGAGLGAFEVAYPTYQSWTTNARVDHAHNDLLEFLAEGGVASALIVMFALAIYFGLVVSRVRKFVFGAAGWLSVGAAMGTCALLVHSLVDFNLHIPANAAWFFALAGIVALPGRFAKTPSLSVSSGRRMPHEFVN